MPALATAVLPRPPVPDGPPPAFGITVSIAHPGELIRVGLQTLVGAFPEVRRASCFASWGALRDRPRGSGGELVLIAAELLDGDRQRAQQLRSCGVKVLVSLADCEHRTVAAAVELEPDGFVIERALDAAELRSAMREVAAGRVHVPAAMTTGLLAEVRRPTKTGAMVGNLLTPREIQTLRLLSEGRSNKQIATRLGIGINGVKRHVGNVLAKLNCPNRTLAAAEAVRLKLI
jgi:two-component system nitrate/nitrite response regulator NarL